MMIVVILQQKNPNIAYLFDHPEVVWILHLKIEFKDFLTNLDLLLLKHE